MGTWKYAMIKVGEDGEEDVCELVEIYPPFAENETPSFARPFLTSLKAIKMALKDVERDGINTWFWKNGTFSWNSKEYFWDWKPNKASEGKE
jgi:hypothetical protein